ncbi:hypothetical protein ACOME3_007844 [Neoechinorhynchus agilis]
MKRKADVLKIMLHAAKQPYRNTFLSPLEFMKNKSVLTIQDIPYVDIDGELLYSMPAIVRFLAKKLHFTGKNDIEAALCDAVLCQIIDTASKIAPFIFAPRATREMAMANFLKDTMPSLVENIDKIATRYGKNGHVIGNSLTYADFAL